MPEIDFSAAYRDAAKGSTIKALQQRRAEAQAAMQAAQQPRQIGSPWQGAAQIGEVISGSIREGRLANQEASARQRFAQLLAGGLAPDEIGEALGLDPETGMKFVERNWATEDATKAAAEAERVRLQERGWSVSDAEQRVRETKVAEERAASREEKIDIRELGQETAGEQRKAAAGAQRIVTGEEAVKYGGAPDRQYRISADQTTLEDVTPEVPETFGPLQTGSELGLPGKAGDQLFQTSLTTNKTGQVGGSGVTVNTGGGSKLDEKLATDEGAAWAGYQKARNVAAGSQADFQMLDELIKMAPQGPIIGNLATLPVLKNFSNAGQAFQSIVQRVAPTLRVEGSGSTSDIEYQGMLNSVPALGNYPEANAMIAGMMKAKAQINIERGNVVDAYRNQEITEVQARQKLAAIDSQSIMTPELQSLLEAVRPGAGAPAAAPPPAGAGGDGKPADIPQAEWDVMTPEEKAAFQ